MPESSQAMGFPLRIREGYNNPILTLSMISLLLQRTSKALLW